VEAEADEDARSLPKIIAQISASDRVCRNPEHEQLLRQHLPQLARRDPIPLRVYWQFVEIEARKGRAVKTLFAEPVALLHAPPVSGGARPRNFTKPQNRSPKPPQHLPRPKAATEPPHGPVRWGFGDWGLRIGVQPAIRNPQSAIGRGFFQQQVGVDAAEA